MPNWWTGRNVRGEMSPWEMLGMSGEMSGKMTGHQQLRWLSGRSWSRNHKHISAVRKTWITNTVDGQKLWRTELWPRSAPPHPPFSLWVAISFWESSESGRLNSMALKRGIKQSQVYRQIVYLLEGNLFYLKPQLFHLIPSNASVPLHEERRRVYRSGFKAAAAGVVVVCCIHTQNQKMRLIHDRWFYWKHPSYLRGPSGPRFPYVCRSIAY